MRKFVYKLVFASVFCLSACTTDSFTLTVDMQATGFEIIEQSPAIKIEGSNVSLIGNGHDGSKILHGLSCMNSRDIGRLESQILYDVLPEGAPYNLIVEITEGFYTEQNEYKLLGDTLGLMCYDRYKNPYEYRILLNPILTSSEIHIAEIMEVIIHEYFHVALSRAYGDYLEKGGNVFDRQDVISARFGVSINSLCYLNEDHHIMYQYLTPKMASMLAELFQLDPKMEFIFEHLVYNGINRYSGCMHAGIACNYYAKRMKRRKSVWLKHRDSVKLPCLR